MSTADRRPRRARSLSVEAIVVVLVFAVVLSFQLRPLWSVLGRSLAPGLGDPLFNLLILEWDMDQFRQGLPDLWGFPCYHPFERSLLLSDHLLGTALQAWGLTALSGSPIAAYNLLLFASFLLSAVLTYAVLRASGLSPPASFLGAAAFAMSPFRWTHVSHLQILLVQWTPLVLYFWDRLLTEPRPRWAVAFSAAYLLHLCGGSYLVYMIHFALLALLVNRGLRREDSGRPAFRRWLARGSLRVLVPTALVCGASVALFFLPYRLLPFDLHRPAILFRIYGATSLGLVTPSWQNSYYGIVLPWLRALARAYPPGRWSAEHSLFSGFMPTLLVLVGLFVFLRARRGGDADPDGPRRFDRSSAGRRRILLSLLLLAATAFFTADLYTFAFELPDPPPQWLRPDRFYDGTFAVMAVALGVWAGLRRRWLQRIGPAAWKTLPVWPRGVLLMGLSTLLLGFPTIFEPLSAWLPGLAAMRVPARFFAFTSFAVAFFAAWGFDGLRSRWTWLRRPATTAAVLLLTLAELTPTPLDWVPQPEPPASHHWLAGTGQVVAVLELPFRDPLQELLYMSSASFHWTPLANGYSGYQPPEYLELRRVCCWPVPEDEALATLRGLGITHLLLHSAAIEAPWARRRLEAWCAEVREGAVAGVRQIYEDDAGDRIFVIDPEGGTRAEKSLTRSPAPQ